jgi:RimJ/RimL family protein N-acetyltransferase
VELSDGAVRLRRFRLDDAPAIARACDDPEMARYTLHIPSPYTLADARAYVEECDRSWGEGTGRRAFAVVDVASDALVGAIDLRLGEIGSVGYWVAAGARGRGVATRALRLLSRWALTDGGVERLELTTHPDNMPSQRVAEKAGFVREGVLRSHARFREGRRDSVLFSLVPGDF